MNLKHAPVLHIQRIIHYTLLSVTTMSGLQVPKSTVCLSDLNIPRLSESYIYIYFFFILNRMIERGDLGPCNILYTQQ